MENESKIEILHQALDLIQEAQCLVDGVMEDSYNKSHYESYGKYGFDQLLGNGNPYDSSRNIPSCACDKSIVRKLLCVTRSIS